MGMPLQFAKIIQKLDNPVVFKVGTSHPRLCCITPA